MKWLLVWTYSIVAPGGGFEYHDVALGQFNYERDCAATALMAPIDPVLQVAEPRIEEITTQNFDCVWVDTTKEPFNVP